MRDNKFIFSEKDFLEAIQTSLSHQEARYKLGYSKNSRSNHTQYTKFLKWLNPNTDHFCLSGRAITNKDLPPGLEAHFNRTKRSAKKNQRDWQLGFEQWIKLITDKCFYCGSEGDTSINGHPNRTCCGIDRINNDIGYIISNCVSCCKECNFMKGGKDSQIFISKCIAIAKKQTQ